MARMLEITYTRSAIGASHKQRRTLEALGLRKLHQTVRHKDNASTRGQINQIPHLVTWREVEENEE